MKYILMIVALMLCVGMVGTVEAQDKAPIAPGPEWAQPMPTPAPYVAPYPYRPWLNMPPPAYGPYVVPRYPYAPPIWRPWARARWWKFNYYRNMPR